MAKRSPVDVITETITRPMARFIEIPSRILSRRPSDKLWAMPQGNIRLLAIPVNGMNLAALITGRTPHFLAFLVVTRLGVELDNLPIKSKLLSVHRRAQQSTAGTILRLKVKTVPTGQKINWG